MDSPAPTQDGSDGSVRGRPQPAQPAGAQDEHGGLRIEQP